MAPKRVPPFAPTDAAQRLSQNLRRLRTLSGLSLRELARATREGHKEGVTVACLSRIESGERPMTSVYTLWVLADALKVEVDDLIGRREFNRQKEQEKTR